jgi:hypothetical protein
LLKERASDDLIVYGPIVLPTNDEAATRFARADPARRAPRWSPLGRRR